MRRGALVIGLGLTAALLAPSASQAQRRDDWYRDVRPYLGREGEEVARRARLVEEEVRLRSAVHAADRRGEITLKESDGLYKRLDRVARFLRDDKHLSDREYNHRRDDLDHVARDLEKATGKRVTRR